jgi:hypothetical protein
MLAAKISSARVDYYKEALASRVAALAGFRGSYLVWCLLSATITTGKSLCG